MGEIKGVARELGERIDLHDLQMKEFNQWRIMVGPKLECIKSLEDWQKENDEAMKRLKKNNGFLDKNKDRFVAGIVGGAATYIISNIGNFIDFLKHLAPRGGG